MLTTGLDYFDVLASRIEVNAPIKSASKGLTSPIGLYASVASYQPDKRAGDLSNLTPGPEEPDHRHARQHCHQDAASAHGLEFHSAHQ